MTAFKPNNQFQSRSITLHCPHCGGRIKTYGSTRIMSDNVQHRYMRCSNEECNASYEVQVAIVREVQAPANHHHND